MIRYSVTLVRNIKLKPCTASVSVTNSRQIFIQKTKIASACKVRVFLTDRLVSWLFRASSPAIIIKLFTVVIIFVQSHLSPSLICMGIFKGLPKWSFSQDSIIPERLWKPCPHMIDKGISDTLAYQASDLKKITKALQTNLLFSISKKRK